jgi:cob(I)alamin adenosyltransferase
MSVYTKKGDKGETALYDPTNNQRKRVSKDSLRIEAIGTVDELNSYLGVVITNSENLEISELLKDVQSNLFTIGSITAGSKLRFSLTKTTKLEKVIDELEGTLPVLSNFILPGGSILAAHIHFARSLSRRAERRMVALNKIEKVRPQILVYMNRLSDFLFMLARKANYELKVADEIWKK